MLGEIIRVYVAQLYLLLFSKLILPCSPEGRGLVGREQARKGRHEFPGNQRVSMQQEDRVRANKEEGRKDDSLVSPSLHFADGSLGESSVLPLNICLLWSRLLCKVEAPGILPEV